LWQMAQLPPPCRTDTAAQPYRYTGEVGKPMQGVQGQKLRQFKLGLCFKCNQKWDPTHKCVAVTWGSICRILARVPAPARLHGPICTVPGDCQKSLCWRHLRSHVGTLEWCHGRWQCWNSWRRPLLNVGKLFQWLQ
jgi:hypothetical protein